MWRWSGHHRARRSRGQGRSRDHASSRRRSTVIAAGDGPGALPASRTPSPGSANPRWSRRLRELYASLRDRKDRFLVLLAPVYALPAELRKDVDRDRLPAADARRARAGARRGHRRGQGARRRCRRRSSPTSSIGFLRGLQGLPSTRRATSLAKVLAGRPLDASAIPAVFEEKARLTRKEGILQFVPQSVRMEDVGGLENLKDWLVKRRSSSARTAPRSSELLPRGRPDDGHLGLRQEPVGQGHLALLGPAAVPPRHDPGLLRRLRHPRGRVRARAARCPRRSPPACCGSTRSRVASPATSPATSGATWRIFSTFLTWMQEKTRAGVRRRHRQPHRPPAGRDDPQGPLRPGLLRRHPLRGRSGPRSSASTSRSRGNDLAGFDL